MRVAVAGGTGTVGAYAVEAVRAAGHEAVVMARSAGVDVRRDEDVRTALKNVDVVIDATNSGPTSRARAAAFFCDVAHRLQSAAAERSVGNVITLSIVGIDRASGYGYYAAKLAQEEAALAGSVPATVIRATQFHEFPAQMLHQLRRGPLAPVPTMRVQTVAARSVAEHLVEVALASPVGGIHDVAGPEVADLVPLARQVARHRGRRLLVVPVRLPGSAGRAMRSGALLPGPGATAIGPRFDDWLRSEDGARPML